MPLSLSLRLEGDDAPAEGASPRARAAPPPLCFDGPEVVIGRANGADVPIPDLEVSPRHATILRDGASYLIRDDGGSIGTLVGGVRIAPGGTRLLASGDVIRIGRVELRVTVDVTMPPGAGSTREMALDVLSKLIRADDDETRVRVVEGRSRGKALVLAEPGRRYILGRELTADLQIKDELASREHVELTREGDDVLVRDLGAKNSAVLGGTRLMANRAVVWHPFTHLRIGTVVLGLEIPRRNVLSVLEQLPESARFDARDAPEEPLEQAGSGAPGDDAQAEGARAADAESAGSAPGARGGDAHDASPISAGFVPQGSAPIAAPSAAASAPELDGAPRAGLGAKEKLVMAVVATILVLCIAGLVWIVTAHG